MFSLHLCTDLSRNTVADVHRGEGLGAWGPKHDPGGVLQRLLRAAARTSILREDIMGKRTAAIVYPIVDCLIFFFHKCMTTEGLTEGGFFFQIWKKDCQPFLTNRFIKDIDSIDIFISSNLIGNER